MRDLAPFLCVEDTNFHDAWVTVLRNILTQGVKITLVDNRGKQDVIDSCQAIILSDYALEQIARINTHPQNPYLSTPTYCKEWTPEFLRKHQENPGHRVYLAYERLTAYPAQKGFSVDQLAYMRESLARQLDGGFACNSCQAITWRPEIDLSAEASPFVQRIWARVYKDKKVDAHFYWRATDAYNHFQSRLICIVNMFRAQVVEQNGFRLTRAVCFYDSLYINSADESSVHHVERVPTNPRANYC